MLWWWLACAPTVDPAAIETLLEAGELDRAAALLAEDDAHPDAPFAASWRTLTPERRAASRVSRDLLRERAESALSGPRPADAGGPLAAALSTWPDDAAFSHLAAQLQARASEAPPEQAEVLWAALLDVGPDPAWTRQQHRRAQLLARYQQRRLPGSLAALEGVDQHIAAELLAIVEAEYVDEVDWSAVHAGGLTALDWLTESESYPGGPGSRPAASSLPEIRGALSQLVSESSAIPERVLVGEYVAEGLARLDPWTRPVWPAEISSWEAHHAGVQVGIGLQLTTSGERVVVQQPLPDTPAWTSGLHQDDVVVQIEDERGTLVLDQVSPSERLAAAQGALIGELDSPVTLTAERQGKQLQRELRRAAIPEQTVEGWQRTGDNRWDPWLQPGIAYVRIPHFKPTTLADFDALLEPHLEQVEAVVLDLRANPGGDVNAAVQLADRFVADGWLAHIEGRTLPRTRTPPGDGEIAEWNQAIEGHALEGVLVAVLVDGNTASAAEVLAGSLQERADALVIGTPTWGKGWVQALRTDPQRRFALQLTNLVWTLPSGRRLVREAGSAHGVVPDVPVAALSPGEAYQLAQARAARTSLRTHDDGTPLRPIVRPVREDLPQLSADPHVLAARWLLAGSLR